MSGRFSAIFTRKVNHFRLTVWLLDLQDGLKSWAVRTTHVVFNDHIEECRRFSSTALIEFGVGRCHSEIWASSFVSWADHIRSENKLYYNLRNSKSFNSSWCRFSTRIHHLSGETAENSLVLKEKRQMESNRYKWCFMLSNRYQTVTFAGCSRTPQERHFRICMPFSPQHQ